MRIIYWRFIEMEWGFALGLTAHIDQQKMCSVKLFAIHYGFFFKSVRFMY